MQASYEKNRKYARIPNPAPFRRTANAPVPEASCGMPGRLGAPRAFLNLCRSRRYERLRIGELPDPQAILFRDSVGIRTQDPQLRRLL